VAATLVLVGLASSSVAAAVPAGGGAGSKPPLCAATAVRVSATTNRTSYVPGQIVKMTSSITNISKTPCSAWLGLDPGFSPSFAVVTPAKKEVWDRCWVNDHPSGCFEIVYQHRLDPGRSYHAVALWDQGSGTVSVPPQRVRPGPYVFYTFFQNIPRTAKVRFTLSAAG
jgi:hypothetical protein